MCKSQRNDDIPLLKFHRKFALKELYQYFTVYWKKKVGKLVLNDIFRKRYRKIKRVRVTKQRKEGYKFIKPIDRYIYNYKYLYTQAHTQIFARFG